MKMKLTMELEVKFFMLLSKQQKHKQSKVLKFW